MNWVSTKLKSAYQQMTQRLFLVSETLGSIPINRIDFLLKKWQLKESNRAKGIEYRPMFVAAFDWERNAVWQDVRKHYNPFYSKTCPIISQCCCNLKASYFKRFQIFDLLLRKNYHQVLWKISQCGHTERESFQVFGVHLLLLSDFPVKEQLQVLHKTYFRSFNFVIKRLLNVQLILNPFLFSFFLLSLSPSLSIYSSIGCPFQPNFDSLFIPKLLVLCSFSLYSSLFSTKTHCLHTFISLSFFVTLAVLSVCSCVSAFGCRNL